ncbi:MAG: hypothetical protein AAF636_20985 [Pseudomonadota bacterium]
MAERFSLKDHLFNPETIGQLAQEYAQALPEFDVSRFERDALAGFPDRELLERLDWIADCIEAQMPTGFPAMADALEAAMPAPLDPSLQDDDFGQFIHAVPGILAVRHGLEEHRARAMDLLYAATQRFSMEFYIRPFLNRWPEETLATLHLWAQDQNYHVRRLVSEGTRPRLPWAKAVKLTPAQTLPLLDRLHADNARYVTRSVANHLNDLAKAHDGLVLAHLADWQQKGMQSVKELDWMRRHALRTLVKQGHVGALDMLGFRADVKVTVDLKIDTPDVPLGTPLQFDVTVSSTQEVPVLVDYRIRFARPGDAKTEKVFKLKQGMVTPDKPLQLSKTHKLKADATTFVLHRGRHLLTVQVNGVDRASASFEIT